MTRENRASRFIILLLWLALPLCWLPGIPARYTAALSLVLGFMLFSHGCQAFIYRDLIDRKHFARSLLKIILFGPLETRYLLKQQKKDPAS